MKNTCFCRCCKTQKHSFLTLDNMLQQYLTTFAGNMKNCITEYRKIEKQEFWQSVTKAICPCCKQKFLHQKRIPIVVLEQWSNFILQSKEKISDCCDFKELYNCIKNIKADNKIKGIGELTIYDTAFRLGIYLNKLPDAFVYLHANAIIPGYTKSFIPTKKLVDNFENHNMPAYMIEDFLCVFHKNIIEQSRNILIIKEKDN